MVMYEEFLSFSFFQNIEKMSSADISFFNPVKSFVSYLQCEKKAAWKSEDSLHVGILLSLPFSAHLMLIYWMDLEKSKEPFVDKMFHLFVCQLIYLFFYTFASKPNPLQNSYHFALFTVI